MPEMARPSINTIRYNGNNLPRHRVLEVAGDASVAEDAPNKKLVLTVAAPNVGPGAGTYGGAGKSISSVTLDAKGRVTGLTVTDELGIAKPGEVLLGELALAARATNDSATPLVVGAHVLNPGDYVYTGGARSLRLRVVLAAGNAAKEARFVLRNLSDGEDVTLTVSGNQQTYLGTTSLTPVALEGDLTVGNAAGQIKQATKLYEARIHVVAPAAPGDVVEVYGAHFLVLETIS